MLTAYVNIKALILPLSTEVWHHLAIVWQETHNAYMYVDGVLKQTAAKTYWQAPWTEPASCNFIIGKQSPCIYHSIIRHFDMNSQNMRLALRICPELDQILSPVTSLCNAHVIH